MVSPRHTAPYGAEAPASNVDRPRSDSNEANHQRAQTIVSSSMGAPSYDYSPAPVVAPTANRRGGTVGDSHGSFASEPPPAAAVTPSCVRQETTSMTLMGLLMRGHQQARAGGARAPHDLLDVPRPAHAAAGPWRTSRVPEASLLDRSGNEQVYRSRNLHAVLEEAVQIIAGSSPTENAASRRLSHFASQ